MRAEEIGHHVRRQIALPFTQAPRLKQHLLDHVQRELRGQLSKAEMIRQAEPCGQFSSRPSNTISRVASDGNPVLSF